MVRRPSESREESIADVFSHKLAGGIATMPFSDPLSLDCDSILCRHEAALRLVKMRLAYVAIF